MNPLHLRNAALSLAVIGAVCGARAAPEGGNEETAGATASAAPLVIHRVGSQPSSPGPSRFFAGAVRVDPLHTATEPARVSTAFVGFEPGARSAWHTHPLGQTLIVTAGAGRLQRWGSPAEVIRPGDTVWIPAGVKHWHGASPTTGMTHIAVTETLDGRNVDWLEQVSEDQYRE